MTSQCIRCPGVPAWLAALLVGTGLVLGCGGETGPETYQVTGTVTYGDKPIQWGDIRFEPKEGLKNIQTVAFSQIRGGRYTVQVVGGPHFVNIRDLTGDVDMGDPENPGGTAMFHREYRGEVDLPKIEQVQGSGPVEQNIEVPTTHK